MWRTHSSNTYSEIQFSQHDGGPNAGAHLDTDKDEHPEIVLPVLVRFHAFKKASDEHEKAATDEAGTEATTAATIVNQMRRISKRNSKKAHLAGDDYGEMIIFPLSGTIGSADSCFFMAFLAPSHESAFEFLTRQSHLTSFVFVLDEKRHNLFLTGVICGQKRVISLYNKEHLRQFKLHVEWDLGRDRVKLKQDQIHHRTRYHVLTVSSPMAFDKLQFLWRNFLPRFQLFAYEMSRHMFFQIETSPFNLKEWFLAIVASAGSDAFTKNRSSATLRNLVKKHNSSLAKSVLVAAQAARDSQGKLQAPAPGEKPNEPVPQGARVAILRTIKSKADMKDTSQVVSILLREAVAKNGDVAECVFYMAKKVLFRDNADPTHPKFRYPLRIIRFDFRQLRIYISDTYFEPTLHSMFHKIWNVAEDKSDYEISVRQLSFSELYKSFVASRCFAPRRFSMARVASLMSTGIGVSGTGQPSMILKHQNTSVILRQSLRRSLVAIGNKPIDCRLDDFEQFFDHALQAFDYVNPSRRIPLQFRKILQDFLQLLCQEEFRRATFSSETTQLRCRITDYLTEFLAATSVTTMTSRACTRQDSDITDIIDTTDTTGTTAASIDTIPKTPTTTAAATCSTSTSTTTRTISERHAESLDLFHKYIRLSIAVLVTRSAEEEFVVVYRCINKLWSQLYQSNSLVSCQIWLMLLELVDLDTLCRDYVLEKAHELFLQSSGGSQNHEHTQARSPGCYLHVNPYGFLQFVTHHLDLTAVKLEKWQHKVKSLVLQLRCGASLELIYQVNDVLRYELIVALAESLFLDASDGISIDQKAAIILNYPKIHHTLFKKILEWTQLGHNEMSPHVLQVLWQCVSVFQKLEGFAKNYVDEQMSFSKAFCTELVHHSLEVISPASCALFIMMEEYLERMDSNRVDEFILICMENLVLFVTSLADRLELLNPDDEDDEELASHKQDQETALLVEMSYHLISIWKLLILKAKSRVLRDLVVSILNEDCFAMHRFLDVLMRKISLYKQLFGIPSADAISKAVDQVDNESCSVVIYRFIELIEAFLEFEQGAESIPMASVEDTMLAQDMTLLLSHFVGMQSSTGRSFWHLLVDFLISTSDHGVYNMSVRFLALLLEVYLHQFPSVTGDTKWRDALVKFHVDAIQNHLYLVRTDCRDRSRDQQGELTHQNEFEALNIHLDCLIVLAETSEFYESFVRLGVASLLVKLLTNKMTSTTNARASTIVRDILQSPPTVGRRPFVVRTSTMARLASEQDQSHRLLRRDSSDSDNDSFTNGNATAFATTTTTTTMNNRHMSVPASSMQEWSDRLQALVLLLVFILTTPAPLYEFDPRVCPRFCVDESCSFDLLYQLQNHFSANKHHHQQQQQQQQQKPSNPSESRYPKAYNVLDMLEELRRQDILIQERSEKVEILIKLLGGIGYSNERYANREYINKGAFGTVFRAMSTSEPICLGLGVGTGLGMRLNMNMGMSTVNTTVAIKQLELQLHPSDRSVVHDLYNEIRVLVKLQAVHNATGASGTGIGIDTPGTSTSTPGTVIDPSVSSFYHRFPVHQSTTSPPPWIRLLDFGANEYQDCFELVFEWCFGTLQDLRAELNLSELPLLHKDYVLLRVFAMVCECLNLLHTQSQVLHLDVKCANVLLRKEPKEIITHVWMETRGFEASKATEMVALGDFGESLVMPPIKAPSLQPQMPSKRLATTTRSPSITNANARTSSKRSRLTDRTRGTEFIKSPEMLYITEVKPQDHVPMFAGQTNQMPTISFASDVWSLGCLWFEWLAEDMLFGSESSASLYTHLVKSQAPLVRQAQLDKLLAHLEPSQRLPPKETSATTDNPGTTRAPDEREHLMMEKRHRAFVDDSVALLELLLKRNPDDRPSLDAICTQLKCQADRLRATLGAKC